MDKEKVVLAFSGGLGTVAALHLLRRRFGANIITYTANLGQKGSTELLCERALQLGAGSAHVADLRERFVSDFVWPAMRAAAVCDSGYFLAHALARPLIVHEMVKIAREEGARYLAHGCASKSNDQVRFEVGAAALAPELKVLAPLRDANLLHLEELVAYCERHHLPTRRGDENKFSITANLLGSSVQWDRAPDGWDEVPEDVYRLTAPLARTPEEPQELVIGFERGVPVSLDGERPGPVDLLQRLGELAGKHGIGRLTTLEDRLIGIKMVEVYEQPAATVVHAARTALERLVLSPAMLEWRAYPSRKYAELTYQGFWFSELREALDAFFLKATEFVQGEVRVRLHRGRCEVTGARSPYSLYSRAMADPTAEQDEFAHAAVRGYMETLSQSVRTGREARESE